MVWKHERNDYSNASSLSQNNHRKIFRQDPRTHRLFLGLRFLRERIEDRSRLSKFSAGGQDWGKSLIEYLSRNRLSSFSPIHILTIYSIDSFFQFVYCFHNLPPIFPCVQKLQNHCSGKRKKVRPHSKCKGDFAPGKRAHMHTTTTNKHTDTQLVPFHPLLPHT